VGLFLKKFNFVGPVEHFATLHKLDCFAARTKDHGEDYHYTMYIRFIITEVD